ncbi:MAG: hypothetical protein KGL39_07715 [Patescibacteria group bacterium]|nr:hypothetical protein [Patescibacteria group bacterium]
MTTDTPEERSGRAREAPSVEVQPAAHPVLSLLMAEYELLMICAKGESVADLGEYSHWHKPIKSLVARGFLLRLDQFNNVITDAGRAALDAYRDQEARDLIRANNALVEARKGAGKIEDEGDAD